jgi:hypothetical protein
VLSDHRRQPLRRLLCSSCVPAWCWEASTPAAVAEPKEFVRSIGVPQPALAGERWRVHSFTARLTGGGHLFEPCSTPSSRRTQPCDRDIAVGARRAVRTRTGAIDWSVELSSRCPIAIDVGMAVAVRLLTDWVATAHRSNFRPRIPNFVVLQWSRRVQQCPPCEAPTVRWS